jgi:hypothetical protein
MAIFDKNGGCVANDHRPEARKPHPTYDSESRLEGGVNRAKLKFANINTTTSRVSVRNKIESAREGAKQIASE